MCLNNRKNQTQQWETNYSKVFRTEGNTYYECRRTDKANEPKKQVFARAMFFEFPKYLYLDHGKATNSACVCLNPDASGTEA